MTGSPMGREASLYREGFLFLFRLPMHVHISEMDLPSDNRYNWFDAIFDFIGTRLTYKEGASTMGKRLYG
ncbi:MAG: hypothetical protein K0Q94_5771, partial [Paenibacillus sp.]|nr:hypothetical protein [Paenibacillus sp.]